MAADAAGERHAVAMLHDEVVGPDVIKRADVGMVQRRYDSRLAVEAQAELLIVSHSWRKDLDSHNPIKARITSSVDLSHTPGANGLDDLVWPEASPRANCHGAREL